MSLVVNSH